LKRFKLVLTLILILSFDTLVWGQMPKTIIVGTVYNIFHDEYPTDLDFFKEVDKDIPLMKESNINHVMIFPMNQWDPAAKQIRFARTDYLIKKIEENHLKFVPIMLKEEQCSYYFPIWKFKEIKGMWNQYNIDNGGKNNRDNIDFADSRVFPILKNYFKKVITRYGKSSALSFYNVWNEPHYSSNEEHVIKEFRKWLKSKYSTLSALRHSWGEEYTSWDQVSPFLTENWVSSMPQIDWKLFRNDLNGMLLDSLKLLVGKYDKVHPVNANAVNTPWADFHDLGGYDIDNWVIADYDDIHGISYYPDGWEREHNLEPCPFWLHNLAFNTIRCAAGKKNYILTELFTNTQNGLALNGYLTKNFVTLLAWTALANNCKGMIYWKWLPFMRGRQSLGRGLCLVDGSLAPRGEAVKEFGAVIKKYGNILYEAQEEKPQAAILVDMVGLLKTLEQNVEPLTHKFMYESNAGLFKALYEKNISVDVLRMDRNIDFKTLRSYKIIYLPFQIVMRQSVANLLKEYVKDGGCVVADARTATLNELDFGYHTNPGAGLDTMFGVVSPDWVGAKSFFKVDMEKDTPYNQIEFEGKYFKEELQPIANVKVLARFADSDEPAITENSYGKGKAVLSAVPLGASYYDKPDNPVNEVIFGFAEQAGVTPDAEFVSTKDDFLNIKIHTLNKGYIIYVINSETHSKNGSIKLNVKGRRVNSLTNIITGKSLPYKQENKKLIIPIEINGEQVMVLYAQF
jgi:beta-galactosidase GanA